MINLRYHIVSITAVFLALGIGIVMGSSFLDSALSDRIQRNVETARDQRDTARQERDQARSELARLEQRDQELMEQGSEELFTDRLSGVPVIILTVGGVDGDSLDTLRSALVASRADFEGTLTISDKLIDENAVEELADILDVAGGNVETTLIDAVSAELLDHGEGQGSEASPPVVSRALVGADFLDYESGPGGRSNETLLASAGYHYVVVTGAEVDVPDDRFLLPLVETMTESEPAPVTVASAATGSDAETREDTRTEALSAFRDDEATSDGISTVDNLEVFEGVAAVIFSLEDIADEMHGHYGFGEGADSLLPER